MSLNTLSRAAAAQAADKPLAPTNDPKTSALTEYIPTETVTLYVALVANQTALGTRFAWCTPHFLYYTCLGLTPIVVAGLFVSKLPEGARLRDVSWRKWPWWPMVAATIAFYFWGWSVPGNPVMSTGDNVGGVVGAIAAVFVSTILAIMAGIAKRL